jgi:hypothetical protein
VGYPGEVDINPMQGRECSSVGIYLSTLGTEPPFWVELVKRHLM